ncbi:MAG: VOC family protein [Chitinophagales bacterium]|nr:VOC family protein [Chitinophagales bacterium]
MKTLIMSLLATGLLAVTTEKQSKNNKPISMKMNAGIVTPKLDETKEFYTSVLGFTIKFENEWFVLLQTPDGEDMISFLQPGHPSQQPVFQSSFPGKGVYLTIEVEDVDEIHAQIKRKGIPIEVELRNETWGDRHFAIIDPNGIGIDIVKYTAPQ